MEIKKKLSEFQFQLDRIIQLKNYLPLSIPNTYKRKYIDLGMAPLCLIGSSSNMQVARTSIRSQSSLSSSQIKLFTSE